MRIVVTQNGANEIKTLSPSQRSRKQRRKANMTETNSLYNSDEEPMPKIKNVSMQRIIQKKIAIPNEMNEKYINPDEKNINKPQGDQQLLSDVLISINKSMDEASNSKLPIIRQAFPLKNIIKPECYQKLKEEVTAKNKIQTKDIHVNEMNFRSEVFNDIEKEFHDQTNKPIKIQNRNLIEYLNTDDTISTKYVKKLAQFDENRIRKLNKICQKAISYKAQEAIIKNIIQNKIKGEFVKDREFYQDRLEEMRDKLRQSHHLVEQDIPKVNKRERYTYQFRRMENEWNKYNIGRYYKKQPKQIQTTKLAVNQLNINNDLDY